MVFDEEVGMEGVESDAIDLDDRMRWNRDEDLVRLDGDSVDMSPSQEADD